MKTRHLLTSSLLFLLGTIGPVTAALLGTAFSYQGRLVDGSQPANGVYDLRFTLYDAEVNGNVVGGPLTNTATSVSNGLFAVTLDFASGMFNGDARWLEIAVRTNGATGTFSVLSPCQPLLAAPYALYTPAAGDALSASIATMAGGFTGPLGGDVAGTQTATVVGRIRGAPVSATSPSPNQLLRYDGSQWTPGSVALATDVTGTLPDVHLSSNIGFLNANQTFTGSNTFNGVVIATNPANVLVGTFTGNGTGLTSLNGSSLAPGTIGGAALGANSVSVDKIAPNQVVKSINGLRDDITLAAGTNTTLTASAQTLTLSTPTDWHVGGNGGTTPSQNFIGTTDSQPLELRVNGQRALRLEPNTNGAPNIIGGAAGNWVAPGIVGSVITGGGVATNQFGNAHTNGVAADCCFLGGGWDNSIQTNAWGSFLGGGSANSVQTNARGSFLGGGWGNSIQMGAFYSFVGGGNSIQTNVYYSLLGGGYGNTIKANASYATLNGGWWNTVGATNSTVAGGYGNNAAGTDAAVGGGYANTANGLRSTVPGGHLNVAGGDFSFAAGRRAKAMAYGDFAWADSTDADFSIWVPDQFAIRAAGGVYIQSDRGIALNAADRPLITRGFDLFDSTAPAQKQGLGRWGLFMEPYNLVLGIPGDDAPGRNFQVGKYAKDGSWTGLMLVDQTGYVQARVFNPTSDRAAKENFTSVNASEILEKVAVLQLSEWNFKQDASARHLGPVAQDFHAAFGLGTDDKHIATVDADGVALAAIQGLNQKLEDQLRARDRELQALRSEVAELRSLVHRTLTRAAEYDPAYTMDVPVRAW